MVPRQKSCLAQISFVIHIKIDQYHSLRSVQRGTSKSRDSKNKQILQPLSKSCPSIYMTWLRVTTKTNKSSNHCLIICCGQGLVVCHCLIICCGQGLVARYCFIIFATKTKTSVSRDFIICCGLGLVVCYCLIICCGQGLVIGHQKQIS